MNQIQGLHSIEELYKKGALEDATYRFAVDVIDLCDQAAAPAWEELQLIKTVSALTAWRRAEVMRWQEKLSEEEFSERFNIGQGMGYGCIEQMFSCIDYELILDLLRKIQPKVARTFD